MAAGGQRSKIDQIWPHKSHFGSAFGSRSSDLDKIWHEHITWPFKQACARISHLSQNPRWLPGVKGPKSTKFDPTNNILARHSDLVHQFGQNLAWAYFLTLQTSLNKNLSVRSKVQNRPNLTPQITFWLGIWILFIRFGQSLAWTYYLTLQTNLWKNFSFSAKSKMTAEGQMSKIN